MADDRHAPRDPLWDTVRAVAIGRVLAWHTWGWSWLSWFAAMPVMFFTAGVLMGGSLDRSGAVTLLRRRLPRLLVPFWVFAAAAVLVMTVEGWRPDAGRLWPWIVPLADPVGHDTTPGLWVPLWYLRAYLWFLLASPVLARIARLGWPAVGLWAGVAVAVTRGVPTLPMAVSDALAFGGFVLAGMVVGRVGLPSRRAAVTVAVPLASLAAGAMVAGRASTVVNASYTMQVAVGAASVGVIVAVAPAVRAAGRRLARPVGWIGRRALSLYVWQGFGLFAAQRLVEARGVDGWSAPVLSGVVVLGVTVALASLAGPVEDRSAGRVRHRPGAVRWAALAAVGGLGVAAAVAVPVTADTRVTAPPSGAVVLGNADSVADGLDAPEHDGLPDVGVVPSSLPAPVRSGSDPVVAQRMVAALDEFVATNADRVAAHEMNWIEIAVARPDGTLTLVRWEPDGTRPVESATEVALFSMSKVFTGAWLLHLVDRGVVALDDPVGRYVDGVPRGDEITLAMLAQHRAGIPATFDSGFFEVDVGADLRRWIAAGEFAHEPGAVFEYSRVGYTLLAWALERASGRSWQDSVRSLAREAGVSVRTDDEVGPLEGNRHPGGGAYYGGFFASGGILADARAGAATLQWVLTRGVARSVADAALEVDAGRELAFYGLGVYPKCPCATAAGRVRGVQIGHAAAMGWMYYEPSTATAVMLTGDRLMFDGQFPDYVYEDAVAFFFDAAAGR